MHKRLPAFVASLALTMGYSVSANALSFSTFVSGSDINSALGQNATIGFAYAGNKFVGSVYFGSNNNQLYQTDLNGQNVKPFGSPIPGASGEIYLSSSLGLGGFASRNIFATAGNSVYQIDNNGNNLGTFVSGLNGTVRGIAFDPYGVYGNEMLVTTTSGTVYRVNSSGVATTLASLGVDTEGLDFAPQAFGSLAKGTLVVTSENTGRLTSISSTGTTTDLGVFIPGGAEQLSFVPISFGGNPLEGLYSARYPSDIRHAGASDFAGLLGDVIVTTENGQRVWQVHPTGGGYTTTDLGSFGGQPEDGIFVTSTHIHPTPEPGTLALFGLGAGALAARRRKKA
ncbi:MAG: PEP-CTERM sorting domain-containing protein [Methylococcaceae bacterium]|nr:PEP-CTERM sorting domain-containing protein [Methylococcaceae bacterium]